MKIRLFQNDSSKFKFLIKITLYMAVRKKNYYKKAFAFLLEHNYSEIN